MMDLLLNMVLSQNKKWVYLKTDKSYDTVEFKFLGPRDEDSNFQLP